MALRSHFTRTRALLAGAIITTTVGSALALPPPPIAPEGQPLPPPPPPASSPKPASSAPAAATTPAAPLPPPPPPPPQGSAAPAQPASSQPPAPAPRRRPAPVEDEEEEQAPRKRSRRDEAPPAYVVLDEGQPMPPGYHHSTRTNRGLLITGIVLGSVGYGFAITYALFSEKARDQWLFVPVFGPALAISARPDCKTNGCGVADRMAIADTLLQAGGLAFVIGAIAAQRSVFVRDDAPLDASTTRPRLLTVLPQTYREGGGGLSFAGLF